jgi:hypothetical protein
VDPQKLADLFAIRQLIDDWVVFSDSGDSERFRSVWHEDGHMMATWTQCSAEQFVAMRRKVFEGGNMGILHFQGGHSAQITGARAIAETKMQILQRADVEGVPCDVTCTGRFYDFLEKRSGRWGMVHRQPIYEKDRLDSLIPGRAPVLDEALLQSFPEGYRHLAYLQARLGYPVKKDMPGLKGPATDALYARGRSWLEGRAGHPKDW